MSKEIQEIRQSIGQIESAINTGAKYMDNEVYEVFVKEMYSGIAALKITIRAIEREQNSLINGM